MSTEISRRGFIGKSGVLVAVGAMMSGSGSKNAVAQTESTDKQSFKIHEIGRVIKEGKSTKIVLDKKYLPAMLRVDKLKYITVVYWFDRNDTPEKRAIMQVHPQGNKKNPLSGVFATHSPVRPNLIAISRCKILSVNENVIEIDNIDAFHNSPVIDLKS